MSNYPTYYSSPRQKQLIRMTFNQLIAQDLENKRPYSAKYNCYCGKCGADISMGEDLYFYGKGNKICLNCHDQIIETVKLNMF